jgi:endonuclease/exonuclease/phosphatase family metal-dependent hydrolase
LYLKRSFEYNHPEVEVYKMSIKFSVMTWNVENLFPPGSFVSPNSRKPVTKEHFEAKLNFLTSFITSLDELPDVIAFQEIGGQDNNDLTSIETLQSRLGSNYPHSAVSQFPDGRHIRVAFLSRIALTNIVDFRDFPAGPLSAVPDFGDKPVTRMSRGALKVEVEPDPGLRIRLVTTHFKSKLLTFPTSDGGSPFQPKDENERAFGAGIALMRRAAEAVTVRTFINSGIEASPDVRTVVLGDLNDEPLAATSQLLLGPADGDIKTDDKHNSNRLYNLVDSIPLRGNNTKEFLAAEERFTRIQEGRGELIDHIMVSRNLLLTHNKEFTVQEVHSFVDVIAGQNVTSNPNARATSVPPDHAPVLARFNL